MRVFEGTQILSLGRVRGSNLTWFDRQFGLAQPPAIDQVFVCNLRQLLLDI
jgi:hypothetical protein